MEFAETITVTHIICFAGLILLACWLLKTSLGTRALADSVPRRNNMPVYLPFIPLFISFFAISLITPITQKLAYDPQDWQAHFMDNIVLFISELITIIVMIFLVRAHFARGLKGFGLNVKTIHKDLIAAFINLLAIWPIVMAVIIITIFFVELISGQEYQMQQHQQLEMIREYPELPIRISIVVTALVIVPLFEEMLFRGFFQTMIRRFFEIQNGAWLAILMSSGLFAITHANAGHWLALFVLGICMGYAYEKSGSLFRPIFIHSLFNAVSIIAVWNQ